MFAKKHTSMFGAFAIDSKASRGRHVRVEGRAQPARCAFEGSAGRAQAFAGQRVSQPLSFDEGAVLFDGCNYRPLLFSNPLFRGLFHF